MMRRNRALAACATALAIATASTQPAIAATATANLTVTATVLASCTVSNATLAFGNYDPTGGNVDQSASLQVACTKGTPATVGLNTGANASGSTRRMGNGTDFLVYELYKEAGRTNVWGNAGSDLISLAAAASNAAQTLTVYGRVSGLQDVSVGSYTDTVVVTVTF
jgi:spore coat protein U-like protein